MGRQNQGATGVKHTGVKYTRDQERAQHAYRMVEELLKRPGTDFEKYKKLVNGFGAGVMRSGLVAALAFLARNVEKKKEEARAFAEHLGKSKIPGLPQANDITALLGAVRELPLDDYMLATREVLRMSVWFRRAVQAAHTEGRIEQPGAKEDREQGQP